MPSILAAAPQAAPPPAAPTAGPVAAAPAASGPVTGTVVGGDARANLYEARAVPVDATAATVTEARDKAFTDGRVAALQIVLGRLAARGDVARLPQPSANDVIDMVREFSVANERTSAVRYLADLTVRFDAEAVRKLLRNAHIAFSEVVSRPLVVLPIYSENAGGSPVLWDANNPWREAFGRLQNATGLVPLILPTGDAQDARLKLEQIANRDANALNALATRYNANGVAIVKATGGTGDAVQIVLTEVRGIAPSTDTILSSPVAGQSRDDALATAAAAVVDALSDNWKRQSRAVARDVSQLTALASLTSLKDWVQIRERLRNVPLVQSVELQAMTRDRAQITLRFSGDPATLGAAFAQQGLVAAQQAGVWMINLPLAVSQ